MKRENKEGLKSIVLKVQNLKHTIKLETIDEKEVKEDGKVSSRQCFRCSNS